MKRTCILLLLLMLVTYIREGYELIADNAPVTCALTGTLSDVADEVIAIPLETNTRCLLSHARQIKRDGNDLFLLSKRQLYHFDCSGKFINQITHCEQAYKNNLLVSDYVIDPVQKQLIVMDDEQNAHYYTYKGDFLGKINLSENRPWNSLIKLSYYNRHIYATANRLVQKEGSDNRQCLEQWLYQFDTAFNEVESHKLTTAQLGRFTLGRELAPEVAVANKRVYVQSPSLQPDQLLRDTLYLLGRNKLDITDDSYSILPLRISNRFLVSTYYNANAADKNYTFCFDRQENKAYNVQGGLEDDFYETGQIPELQAMDVHSNLYCYYKTGEEVKKAFPDRKENDNPVLFIVKLIHL